MIHRPALSSHSNDHSAQGDVMKVNRALSVWSFLIDVLLWTKNYVLIIEHVSQMCATHFMCFFVASSFELVSFMLLSSGSVYGICRYWWSLLRAEDPLCRCRLLVHGQL